MPSVGYLDPCCCQKKLQCAPTVRAKVLVSAGASFVLWPTSLLKKKKKEKVRKPADLTTVVYEILYETILIIYLLSISERVT